MHRLLERQLKRYFGGEMPTASKWSALLQAISESYADFDLNRDIVERSLLLSSRELKEHHARIVDAERKRAVASLERELAIARHIQTSIVPRAVAVRGFEIAARMETASEVGGDYYDVQPGANGGCWFAIGDVSGHGLDAGLIMLMVQSGLSTLVRAAPVTHPDPAALLCLLNGMLHENIRLRLTRDDFVTLCLFFVHPDGEFTIAGKHESLIIWRASTRNCEEFETNGAWLGIMADIRKHTSTATLQVKPGDILVAYTDGLIEARNASGEVFGIDRLVDVVKANAQAGASAVCDALFAAVDGWANSFEDDRTAVVARYVG